MLFLLYVIGNAIALLNCTFARQCNLMKSFMSIAQTRCKHKYNLLFNQNTSWLCLYFICVMMLLQIAFCAVSLVLLLRWTVVHRQGFEIQKPALVWL